MSAQVIQIPRIEALPEVIGPLLEAFGNCRKIALYGDMGAGKTTLVKAIAAHLGVRENTASPTFSLVNQYSYTHADGTACLMHHLDLYRLRNIQEALDIGIEDLLDDPWYCFIEWPQVIEPLLPENTIHLTIEAASDQTRRIILH